MICLAPFSPLLVLFGALVSGDRFATPFHSRAQNPFFLFTYFVYALPLFFYLFFPIVPFFLSLLLRCVRPLPRGEYLHISLIRDHN